MTTESAFHLTPDGISALDSARRTTVVLAVTGFVLSFLAVLDIAGLVLSIVAFRRARTTGGPRGLALAVIIIAGVTIVLAAVAAVVLVVVFNTLFATCADLAAGTHYVDGVTYTCS